VSLHEHRFFVSIVKFVECLVKLQIN
jgi:hypothetical protein